jgi:hypothetical protein
MGATSIERERYIELLQEFGETESSLPETMQA